MAKKGIYLAVNYFSNEWELTYYDLARDALQAVRDVKILGHDWKVLRELDFNIDEGKEGN